MQLKILKMTIIDTHAHIYLPEFEYDRSLMLENASQAGVTRVLMPAIDSSHHFSMMETEKINSNSYLSMMGVHPCSIKDDYKNELKMAIEHLTKRKFVAVGETGLDFYWDLTFTDQQYQAFHEQIEWALHFDIPVVIHSRNSIDECIKTISTHQKGKLKAVFHCFSGNVEQARQIINLNGYLGIGGVLTFKNSGLDKVIKEIDLKNIVLETDAPYLAPVPFRGKRNECSYLKYVVQKLSEIKALPETEVAEITTVNAEKLFGL